MKPLNGLVRVVGELVIKKTTPDLFGKIVSWLTQPFLLHSQSGLSHLIAVNDIDSVTYNKCTDHWCSGQSAHMLILDYDTMACFEFCWICFVLIIFWSFKDLVSLICQGWSRKLSLKYRESLGNLRGKREWWRKGWRKNEVEIATLRAG